VDRTGKEITNGNIDRYKITALTMTTYHSYRSAAVRQSILAACINYLHRMRTRFGEAAFLPHYN
jgi:hypothetical protein